MALDPKAVLDRVQGEFDHFTSGACAVVESLQVILDADDDTNHERIACIVADLRRAQSRLRAVIVSNPEVDVSLLR